MKLMNTDKKYEVMDCGEFVSSIGGKPVDIEHRAFCFAVNMKALYMKNQTGHIDNENNYQDTYKINNVDVIVEGEKNDGRGFLILKGNRFKAKKVLTDIIKRTKFKLDAA